MSAGLPPNLAAAVARIRLRAEAAFLARLNAGTGFGDARAPTQIHLRDGAAGARLGRVAARPSDTHKKAAAEVAAAIAELGDGSDGADDSRLALLATRFALTAAEDALVRIAFAYAIDVDTRA